jgi:hypothetical protein
VIQLPLYTFSVSAETTEIQWWKKVFLRALGIWNGSHKISDQHILQFFAVSLFKCTNYSFVFHLKIFHNGFHFIHYYVYSYIGSIIFSYSLVIVLKHEILKNVKKNNSRIIDDVRSDYLFEFSLTVFIFPHNVICQFFVKNVYVLCSLSNGRPLNFFLLRSAIH